MPLTLGEYSYAYEPPTVVGDGAVTVGKFCSIAAGVRFITWGHHLDWISTYPFGRTVQTKGWPQAQGHPVRKGGITIGHDVWIGDSALIFDGVTVHDGAVISAGSVVTSDVRAYSVVAGNPAERLFYRFKANTIVELGKLKWWDLPIDDIKTLVPLLCASNEQALLDYCERTRMKAVCDGPL